MPSSDDFTSGASGIIDMRNFPSGDDPEPQGDWVDRLCTALGPIAGPIVAMPLRSAQLGARDAQQLMQRVVDRIVSRDHRSMHEPVTLEEERALGEAVAAELRDELGRRAFYQRLRAVLELELKETSDDPMRHAMLCRMIDDLDATQLRSTLHTTSR